MSQEYQCWSSENIRKNETNKICNKDLGSVYLGYKYSLGYVKS